MPKPTHDERKWMKLLKRHLQLNRREREMGIPDLRWIDGSRLPK
jgi:hypothetical protein